MSSFFDNNNTTTNSTTLNSTSNNSNKRKYDTSLSTPQSNKRPLNEYYNSFHRTHKDLLYLDSNLYYSTYSNIATSALVEDENIFNPYIYSSAAEFYEDPDKIYNNAIEYSNDRYSYYHQIGHDPDNYKLFLRPNDCALGKYHYPYHVDPYRNYTIEDVREHQKKDLQKVYANAKILSGIINNTQNITVKLALCASSELAILLCEIITFSFSENNFDWIQEFKSHCHDIVFYNSLEMIFPWRLSKYVERNCFCDPKIINEKILIPYKNALLTHTQTNGLCYFKNNVILNNVFKSLIRSYLSDVTIFTDNYIDELRDDVVEIYSTDNYVSISRVIIPTTHDDAVFEELSKKYEADKELFKHTFDVNQMSDETIFQKAIEIKPSLKYDIFYHYQYCLLEHRSLNGVYYDNDNVFDEFVSERCVMFLKRFILQ